MYHVYKSAAAIRDVFVSWCSRRLSWHRDVKVTLSGKATIIELDNNRGNAKKMAKTFKISRTCVVRWRAARDDIFKANNPNSDTDGHEHEHEGGSPT